MKTIIVVEAKTGVDTAAEFEVTSNSPRSVVAGHLAGVEAIGIEVWDGAAWRTAGREGQAISVKILDNPIVVLGPGRFRINKPTTANACSVALVNEHQV